MEKICENACKLTLIGESFDCASEYAMYLNREKNNTVYIITGSQMQNIFFSGCSQEHINEYLKGHFKRRISNDKWYLYMPLPENFKEDLTDLNALFLASNKVMNLD